MARKPLGKSEARHSEWTKHLKPYGKQQVNAGQRRDGQIEIRTTVIEQCYICKQADYAQRCLYCDQPTCRDHGEYNNDLKTIVCQICKKVALEDHWWFMEEIS